MTILWVDIETLMKVSGWSSSTIDNKSRPRKGKPREIDWRSKKTAKRGRPPREYYVPSLPSEIQTRINRLLISDSAAPTSALAVANVPLCSQVALNDSARASRHSVTKEEEAQSRELYTRIKPYIDFCNHPLELKPTPLMTDAGLMCTHTQMAKYIAAKNGWHISKLYRLHRRFIEGHDRDGLLRKVRTDKGKSRFFEQHPEAQTLALYVYLEQRQSIRRAHESILRDRESLNIREDELPSYSTVRSFLKSLPAAYPTLAREGRRAYRERMAPYVSRGYTEKPNDIWVSDHMIHDVEAQNDCFLDAQMGEPIRLRFTCILDYRSRYVVGTSWCWEGSSRSIASALRDAVSKHGPARMLYCDNGKDYLKVAKGAMPGYLRSTIEPEEWYARELQQIDELGLLARLGMSVQHCIVRHPQSKHVERFFRTLHERFDKIFPTYTGGSPGTRPDFTADAMADHRRLLRMGMPHRSRHPMASDIIRMCRGWIEEYHQRPHGGKGMEGRSPAEVFSEREQRSVPTPDQLVILLSEHKRRLVHECAVMLNKRRYIGCDEVGRALLHELNEREVIVAFDPLDMDAAAILDVNGRLLTWAKAENYLPQSSAASGAIAESMAERRRLEKQTASTIVAIGDMARSNGAVTEVEHLARRVQVLPMAVGDHITQRRVRIRPDDSTVAPLSPEDAAAAIWKMED